MKKFILNLFSTLCHKFFVAFYITRFSLMMIWRGLAHDNSKLRADEFKGYASVIDKLSGSTYGSSNFNANKEKIRATIQLHYSRNSHHPEHHKNFQNMDLYEISEMVFDWISAARRHKDGNVIRSILINQQRFGIPKKLTQIFLNTVLEIIGPDKYMILFERATQELATQQKVKSIIYTSYNKEKRAYLKSCPNPDCCSDGLQLELCRNFDYVSCRSCGVHGPMFDGHPDDAIDGWNDLPRE
jgi:hypothetical protein